MDDLVKRIAALEKELATLKAQVKPTDDAGIPADRKPWPKYDPTEGFRLPASAAKAMAQIVPDLKPKAGFDAHAHVQTKIAAPGGFGPETKPQGEPPVRGTGSQKEQPLSPPPGIRHIDAIAEHFAEVDRAQDATKRIAAAVLGQKIK